MADTVWTVMDLPNVRPIQTLSRDDLIEVLEGIEAGWYRTSDLLPRFEVWAQRRGRETPTAKAIGESISRHFRNFPRKMTTGALRAWHITPEGVQGRDWFQAPPSPPAGPTS